MLLTSAVSDYALQDGFLNQDKLLMYLHRVLFTTASLLYLGCIGSGDLPCLVTKTWA